MVVERLADGDPEGPAQGAGGLEPGDEGARDDAAGIAVFAGDSGCTAEAA